MGKYNNLQNRLREVAKGRGSKINEAVPLKESYQTGNIDVLFRMGSTRVVVESASPPSITRTFVWLPGPNVRSRTDT